MEIPIHISKNPQTHKSLIASIWDGAFASLMVGFIQDYFTPFLLFIGGTIRHVGFLSALPNLFGSLIQLISADIADTLKSRKKIIIIFVLLQACIIFPMSLCALFRVSSPAFFITLVILFTAFGAIATPTWSSLMADLVAHNKRGEYFGWRNRLIGFITVGATFIAGFILHYMKKINIWNGFFIIFISAFLCRLISWYFLTRMHEPHLTHAKEHYFTIFDFLKRIRESNFAKFVLFVSMMNLSVNIASPFFAVFMIRDLHFNYMLYTVIIISATLMVNLTVTRWGKHADKIGNLKIIKFTAPFIGIIPLLWVINQHPATLICIQIFAGFVWAGFNLCTSNFIYDAVTPEKRTRCIAYFNVINGVSLSAGALLGGFLAKKLPPLFGYNLLTLFVISAILRILVGMFLPKKLKEVRPVEPISSNDLFFSMLNIKPILGIERKTLRY